MLASHYGLRRSEILGLRWSAIDFTNKTITINHTVTKSWYESISVDLTKSRSSYRTFPLQVDVEKKLKELYNQQRLDKALLKGKYIDTDYICKWKNGKPFRPDYVTQSFRYYLKKYNLPLIRFHDLRHSAASMLVNAGFSLLEVCEWLGHADINTTKRYLHLAYSSKENMARYINQALSAPIGKASSPSVYEVMAQDRYTDYK